MVSLQDGQGRADVMGDGCPEDTFFFETPPQQDIVLRKLFSHPLKFPAQLPHFVFCFIGDTKKQIVLGNVLGSQCKLSNGVF